MWGFCVEPSYRCKRLLLTIKIFASEIRYMYSTYVLITVGRECG